MVPLLHPITARNRYCGPSPSLRCWASPFGIVVASQGVGHFVVWCPELDHDDPLEGRNETGDVRVVLEQVEEYQRCLQGGYLEAVTDPRLM